MKRRATWFGTLKLFWLKHEADEVGDFRMRVLVHIPVGFIMGILPFSGSLKDLLIAYEENEDLHTKDQAWKDYYGVMIGFVLGRLALVVSCVWGVLWMWKRFTSG